MSVHSWTYVDDCTLMTIHSILQAYVCTQFYMSIHSVLHEHTPSFTRLCTRFHMIMHSVFHDYTLISIHSCMHINAHKKYIHEYTAMYIIISVYLCIHAHESTLFTMHEYSVCILILMSIHTQVPTSMCTYTSYFKC